MSSIWFTSDTHYDHENVIRYCDRPFARDLKRELARPSEITDDPETDPLVDGDGESRLDVHTMNETMIWNWNEVVRDGDIVYHLGDVMLGPGKTFRARLAALRQRLRGEITLILGNHDRGANTYLEAGFERVMRSYLCHAGEVGLVHMRHHPPRAASPMIELCGHVHEKWKRRGNVFNVGVDQWNFSPVNLDEILAAPDSV
jgi:calcineurin-like phosphoesterase family protein